jgi:hypothetical protein
MATDQSSLGSLAQSARQKQLKSARGILLFVGILTVGANATFFALIRSQVDEVFNKEITALQAKGMVVDQAKVAPLRERAVRMAQLINGGAIALGVVFIVLGVIVNRYPVPITILGLVLYVGGAAVFALIDASTLAQGLIVKLIIIVALVKSIQSALAYEREQKTATGALPS